MALRKPLIVLGFLLAGLVVYSAALRAGFAWDDDSYVTENPNLETSDGLARVWLEPTASPQYYPLVFTSFWLERKAWGLDPFGYHLVNVLLHVANALLVWRMLARLRVPGAAFAGAVFLLHPVHVESVAWITERKNALALSCFAGAALAWWRYRPPEADAEGGRAAWAAAAFLAFACALASKTITACLPAALLLVVWWKRGTIRWRDALPLVPFFALGAVMGLATAHLERTHVGAVGDDWALSPLERTLIAGRAPWFYLGKLMWPARLAFFYPRWELDAASAQLLFPLATLALLALLWAARRRIGRGPLVATLFFGGALLPALGFFDVYPFRFSFVADHFQYLASIGPIALVAAAAARWDAPAWVRARAPLGLALLAGLGWLSWRQTHVYRDLESLWSDTIAKNPDGWAAYTSLGLLYCEDQARRAEGERLLAEGFRRSPGITEAWTSMAYAHFANGRVDEALDVYAAVLERYPRYAEITADLGLSSYLEGRREDGLRLLVLTLERVPDSAPAHLNLGSILAQNERFEEARGHFEDAVRLDPENADAQVNLGRILALSGDAEAAERHYRRALELEPDHERARAHLERLEALRPGG